MNGWVLLQREQLLHHHAAGLGHPRQVVPQQVHDHHVLGTVLLALLQLSRKRCIAFRVLAPRPGALDRAGLQPSSIYPQEEFG